MTSSTVQPSPRARSRDIGPPRPPLTVKLVPEKVLYVDAALLAGWIGRVVPRVVAPAAGGDNSAPFVECSGEGVIIALEPGPEGDAAAVKEG